MDRRDALRYMARVGGAGALAALAPDELLALGARVHRAIGDSAAEAAPGALTAARRRTAAAAMDAIIPRTDTPGAVDAGGPTFLAAMLDHWFTPAERDGITGGLDALDAHARATLGTSFAAADPARRLPLLEALDAEVASARAAPAARPSAPAGPLVRRGAGAAADQAALHWWAAFRFVTVWAWGSARVVQEGVGGTWPMPGRYDPDAPVRLRRAGAAR